MARKRSNLDGLDMFGNGREEILCKVGNASVTRTRRRSKKDRETKQRTFGEVGARSNRRRPFKMAILKGFDFLFRCSFLCP